MRRLIALGTLALVFLGACRDGRDGSGPYLGQAPPGEVPEVFAPGIVSLDGRFEQFLAFAPDGRSLVFGVTNADWSAFTLRQTTWQDGEWTTPTVPPFLGSDSGGLTAALSFDGARALFTAARPTYPPADVWIADRTDGGWSEPRKLGPPISSDADEFEVAISRQGTLYFSSTREGGEGDIDLYRAPLLEGGYPAAEHLGPPINSPSGDDLPAIAPDESYLIFASDRPGGLGQRDLYISYQVGGVWTEPRNLGAPINSEQWDIYPSVSPDGRYLFFTRRAAWQTDQDSDIYWVRASFIERLRDSAAAPSGTP